MVGSMRILILTLFAALTASSWAQYSIGGGTSMLFQFGNNKPFGGLHFNFEIPRNNEVTFYGRVTYHFRQNSVQNVGEEYPVYAYGIDPNTNPYTIEVPYSFKESFNYFMIDGGTRYYLINGYDEGFSLYGGTNIGVVINSLKYRYELGGYDQTKYYVPEATPAYDRGDKGTVLNLAAGFSGGVKYTIPGRGTFYFDFNPAIMLFGMSSKTDLESTLYRNVVFNFNIGYRKEFY